MNDVVGLGTREVREKGSVSPSGYGRCRDLSGPPRAARTGPAGPSGRSGAVASGRRFPFGKNWRRFLALLDEDRIAAAVRSLESLLGAKRLDGRTFLDVGSGSGLFSLAAMRLGAAAVHSFDCDPESVGCAEELRRRFFPGDARWRISEGSILDPAFAGSLGLHDIVYAWGVLHHTGEMWRAMENVCGLVAPGGTLVVAIYNDQGLRSRTWRGIKRLYCATPTLLRPVAFLPIPLFFEAKKAAGDLARGRLPFRDAASGPRRGMSRYHDWVDWLGGYPFEVATPEEVLAFFRRRGYALEKLATEPAGYGNNEYVFRAPGPEPAGPA